MNDDTDARIATLLLDDAPPAHDLRFRISLLERRERQLYRQRAMRRVLISVLGAVLPGVALFMLDQPMMTALLAGLVICLVLAGLRVMVATRQAWRWATAYRSSGEIH